MTPDQLGFDLVVSWYCECLLDDDVMSLCGMWWNCWVSSWHWSWRLILRDTNVSVFRTSTHTRTHTRTRTKHVLNSAFARIHDIHSSGLGGRHWRHTAGLRCIFPTSPISVTESSRAIFHRAASPSHDNAPCPQFSINTLKILHKRDVFATKYSLSFHCNRSHLWKNIYFYMFNVKLDSSTSSKKLKFCAVKSN